MYTLLDYKVFMEDNNRKYNINVIDSIRELAVILTQSTWDTYMGFQIQNYLFLNLSNADEHTKEYAVVNRSTMVQIKTIDASLMCKEEMVNFILNLLCGKFDGQFVSIINEENLSWEGEF